VGQKNENHVLLVRRARSLHYSAERLRFKSKSSSDTWKHFVDLKTWSRLVVWRFIFYCPSEKHPVSLCNIHVWTPGDVSRHLATVFNRSLYNGPGVPLVANLNNQAVANLNDQKQKVCSYSLCQRQLLEALQVGENLRGNFSTKPKSRVTAAFLMSSHLYVRASRNTSWLQTGRSCFSASQIQLFSSSLPFMEELLKAKKRKV
jgi:hypothetical protein